MHINSVYVYVLGHEHGQKKDALRVYPKTVINITPRNIKSAPGKRVFIRSSLSINQPSSTVKSMLLLFTAIIYTAAVRATAKP